MLCSIVVKALFGHPIDLCNLFFCWTAGHFVFIQNFVIFFSETNILTFIWKILFDGIICPFGLQQIILRIVTYNA